MTFHDSVEYSLQSSRVILSGHHHNGAELMLVAPRWKHLSFTFIFIDSGDLHDIRYAKRPQLAKLPCPPIVLREPPADELVAYFTRRAHKDRNSF